MLLRSVAHLLFCLVPGSAIAQADSTPEPRLATKAQYLACLSDGDIVEAKQAALVKQREDLKAYAAKFQAADASLAKQVKRHAPSNQHEVDSYNRAVQTRNQAAKAFNEQSRSIERGQVSLNSTVFEFNSRCGGILVSAEVKEAAELERRRPLPLAK